jgi:hypothetical protein
VNAVSTGGTAREFCVRTYITNLFEKKRIMIAVEGMEEHKFKKTVDKMPSGVE